MKLLKKIFGDEHKRAIKALQPTVKKINDLEEEISSLSDADLQGKTAEFKKALADGKTLDDILPEAFAVVREVSKRVHGERHFDVQLIGGIVIHQGKIAEMRTGEGKTLVATLPAYLNALNGKGVHIVTVNDYLARRDAVWMGEIYDFLGISVSAINSSNISFIYDQEQVKNTEELDEERDEEGSHKVVDEFLRPISRREAYETDITYGTNSEFGFDYLRDNLEYVPEQIRQKEHPFAIIDEVDSILIDEARTPLIISAPAAESEDLYQTFATIAGRLKEDEDYTVDEKLGAISLTESGISKAEEALGVENIYTERGIKYVHHLETAVRAKALFKRDDKYMVRDGSVIIVDEFTGRLQPGRRYSAGLHQAIEAKEGVAIQKESKTVASVTYQNFFRLYDKLSGMTGTAETSSEEFYKTYGLDTVVIPTNKPIARIDRNDQIFKTEQGKFKAVARKLKELHKKGQPVLVGTVSVDKNELLSSFLKKEGVPHEVLNAKNHAREGEIISEAGKKGRVTIATNMAGRGVDIKLGGPSATEEERQEILELGGLFVLGTERHEARRIDNQLRGRAGRQGDPGETQFYVSLEDSLMRVFASGPINSMMGRLGVKEDEPIEHKMITRSLESAQEKIEGFNFDSRKRTLEYDDVLNRQRSAIYEKRLKVLTGDIDDIEDLIFELAEGDKKVADLIDEKEEALGEETFWNVMKRLYLQTLDKLWMDHLDQMDYLRSSVNLRAYGQHDPLVEYKKEALRLFRELNETLKSRVIGALPNIDPDAFKAEAEQVRSRLEMAKRSSERQGESPSTPIQRTEEDKIGRNDIVKITDGNVVKEMKYKKAKEMLNSGWRMIESDPKTS
ncbi:MAG: preprotein translocase subunit SecA [Candidatus Campbellbacteria bacterium]|nr:preprotein translocase subunit SecA [Candidatus Campbellbacteria bacterium]